MQFRNLAPGARRVLVDGGAGLYVTASERPYAVLGMTFGPQGITEIDILLDPERLGRAHPSGVRDLDQAATTRLPAGPLGHEEAHVGHPQQRFGGRFLGLEDGAQPAETRARSGWPSGPSMMRPSSSRRIASARTSRHRPGTPLEDRHELLAAVAGERGRWLGNGR